MNQIYTFNRLQNNFDFIRFIAAVGVVYTHCYDLLNQHDDELLRQHTGTVYSISFFGVRIFFIISGFLITKSLLNSSSAWNYFRKRFLRIFPGLLVAVFLTVFVLGPLVTRFSWADYFSQKSTYTYLLNSVLYRSQRELPGVFDTVNSANLVNGSLWTLVYEFSFYIGLYLLFITRLLHNRIWIFILWLGTIALEFALRDTAFFNFFFPSINMGVSSFLEFSIFYLSGTLMALYQDKIVLTKYAGWASLAVLSVVITQVPPAYSKVLLYFILPYAVFFVSFLPGKLNRFGKVGDFSYGVYIYSFPIQQTLLHYLTPLSMGNFIALSMSASLLVAFLSWRFVEAPCLRLKEFSLKKPAPISSSPAVLS